MDEKTADMYQYFTTPVGKAYFCKVFNPEEGYGTKDDFKKYDSPKFRVGIIVPIDKARSLMGKIDELMVLSKANAKTKRMEAPPYEVMEDGENVLFKMVQTKEAGGQSYLVVVVDREKRPVNLEREIGAGSIIRVYFQTRPWAMGGKSGITLRPVKVQLIEYRNDLRDPRDDADPFDVESPTSDDDGDDIPF